MLRTNRVQAPEERGRRAFVLVLVSLPWLISSIYLLWQNIDFSAKGIVEASPSVPYSAALGMALVIFGFEAAYFAAPKRYLPDAWATPLWGLMVAIDTVTTYYFLNGGMLWNEALPVGTAVLQAVINVLISFGFYGMLNEMLATYAYELFMGNLSEARHGAQELFASTFAMLVALFGVFERVKQMVESKRGGAATTDEEAETETPAEQPRRTVFGQRQN